MPSGMESFLTGFAPSAAKGLEKGQDTFNKLFGDRYLLQMKQQIPEYEYRNVKGVGLVYVNKGDPKDIRVAIKEVPEEEKKKPLTASTIRTTAMSGGFGLEEDYQTYIEYGIPPERITQQEGGGLMIIGEKQIQEDRKQKINVFETLAGEIGEKSRYSDTAKMWNQARFEEGAVSSPEYPIETVINEYNKIRDIEGIDSTNAQFQGWLEQSKIFTKNVINEQVVDILKEAPRPSGIMTTISAISAKLTWNKNYDNLYNYIKSNIGGLDEDEITAFHVRNQYEELKQSGKIESVEDVEGLFKKEKELMKLNYGGVVAPAVSKEEQVNLEQRLNELIAEGKTEDEAYSILAKETVRTK